MEMMISQMYDEGQSIWLSIAKEQARKVT